MNRIIVNTITQSTVKQAKALDKEIMVYDNSVLISETDIKGIITYINRRFINLSGFSKSELIGSPHNIIRHPDMPRGVFKAMWKIISEKKIWRGYIKHLCKDGSFFWTLTYIQSEINNVGEIVGYTSTSKIAYIDIREEVESKYKELFDDKHIDNPYFMISESYYEQYIVEEANKIERC